MATRTKTATSSKRLSRRRPRGDSSVADVLTDFATAYRLLESGQLAEHAGQLVAVLRGQVVGAGLDANHLRRAISRTHHVSPERIAMIRVFDQTTVYG